MPQVLLPTEADTRAWGRARGSTLAPGDVVALVGGLGAGKTQAAKGLAEGLGFTGEVTSPTFPIVHEYHGGRIPVFHFDFHRLDSDEEVLALGWEEILDVGGVCVVEWADKFPQLLPAATEWWQLVPGPGGGRAIEPIVPPPCASAR
jgi:tRNA threonylcarbamoyladenosine biosynthesis protein TsaE